MISRAGTPSPTPADLEKMARVNRAWNQASGTREPPTRVAPEILQIVQHHVEEISRTLAQLEPGSPFWISLRESGLSFEMLGWKFTFSVEADKLVLTAAEPVPAHVT